MTHQKIRQTKLKLEMGTAPPDRLQQLVLILEFRAKILTIGEKFC